VISLHDVSPAAREPFVEKMKWLIESFNVVSLGTAYRRTDLDCHRLNVALTFDDGYREHSTFVAPLLQELDVPATFFVPSAALDLSDEQADRFSHDRLRRSRSFQFMTSEELKELAGHELFAVGGHTRTHADLGQIGQQDELDAEIIEDKRILEKITGQQLRWFAFPFGASKNATVQALHTLERSGYEVAFTIVPGFWSTKSTIHLVGRDALEPAADWRLWSASLRGGYDPISWLKHRRRLRALGRALG
jgi:peptidoglycan/xylan/chitin deacetylase (PgdA/CDA1 family)